MLNPTEKLSSKIKENTSLRSNEAIFEYFIALLFSLILFIVFSLYLYNRRGFYDLYIINKVFAGVAVFQLGIMLLFGSLCRMFSVFDHYLKYRKEFGVIAFVYAVSHGIVSLFFLRNYFSIEKYLTTGKIPFIFGMLGLVVLFGIMLISNKKSMMKIGFKQWWPLQYWGVRIAFLAVALHVFVMKLPSWIEWYTKGGTHTLVHPEWPGLGLLEGWFIFFVIFIRIAEAIHINLGKLCWYLSIIALPLIYFLTFQWGTKFLP